MSKSRRLRNKKAIKSEQKQVQNKVKKKTESKVKEPILAKTNLGKQIEMFLKAQKLLVEQDVLTTQEVEKPETADLNHENEEELLDTVIDMPFPQFETEFCFPIKGEVIIKLPEKQVWLSYPDEYIKEQSNSIAHPEKILFRTLDYLKKELTERIKNYSGEIDFESIKEFLKDHPVINPFPDFSDWKAVGEVVSITIVHDNDVLGQFLLNEIFHGKGASRKKTVER